MIFSLYLLSTILLPTKTVDKVHSWLQRIFGTRYLHPKKLGLPADNLADWRMLLVRLPNSSRWIPGLAAIVMAAGPLLPFSAHAQLAVACVNCSTNMQQLIGYAKQLEQAITEANQLQQQIQMYENMALNTANLPRQLYGNVASDLNGVDAIMGRAQGISYAASSLDSTFASHFPGYQAYSAQPNMSNMSAKYQQWSNDMNTSTHSVFSAAQAQNSQMTSETQLLNSLQSQNMSAQGREQSAQIANELSAQQVAQMQKLRQLMMLQMQQEGTFLQTRSDQDAQRAANGAQAFVPANLPSSGNPRY